MTDVIPAEAARFVRAMVPPADGTVAAMEEYGETHGPTTVGREVGALFRWLARTTGAERVFEFGSGYGYSGYWFALGLPRGGQVVLTDVDGANAERAREFFRLGGLADCLTFEVGDAHEVVERYDGPFDAVLVDHDKARYRDAYEAVREKVAPGGLLLADNAMASTSIQFDVLLSALEDGGHGSLNESTRGVYEYLRAVREDPEFETVVVPLGEGVAVSRKHG